MTETRAPYGRTRVFDYQQASTAEILDLAASLRGKTLGEIATRPAVSIHSTAETKGNVGAIYERYFGIPANSRQEADFPRAGVELKSVPVVRRGSDWYVKERTFISMIQYNTLVREQWEGATVRKKISNILFVFYEWKPETDMYDFRTLETSLWSPEAELLPILAADWEVVRRKVADGRAELISEGDGRVMGAATKSATGASRTTQPFSAVLAKPRGWAFKPSLAQSLIRDVMDRRPIESITKADPSKSVAPAPQVVGVPPFEVLVLRRLEPWVGTTLSEVGSAVGVTAWTGKSRGAVIVRRLLGIGANARIKEFERLGIEVKMVPMSEAGTPYEAMSFPAFRHKELVEEDWEDSDLLSRLNRLLIFPVVRPAKEAVLQVHRLGRPFFWSPSAAELNGIHDEWSMYCTRIREGYAGDLPKESRTNYIHVRPHGRDAKDVDIAPLVGPVPKKSFWLNKSYLARIVLESGPEWSGRPSKHVRDEAIRPPK